MSHLARPFDKFQSVEGRKRRYIFVATQCVSDWAVPLQSSKIWRGGLLRPADPFAKPIPLSNC